MEHAKRLYLIDEFDREYKRVQCPSAVVAKARSAVQLDDTLRSSELDNHEKAREYVAKLHRYLNVTAPPPVVCKRVAAQRRSTVDAAASRPSSSTAALYFKPLQTRSQLRQQQQQQQQQQLLHQQQQLQQQQQQLLQRQWARTDPDGDINDDDDDDDDDEDDGDAKDEDVDEVFRTPLLPHTPPSAARPAAKKFKSAAAVAATTAGGKKKKKSPSIKKIQQRLERARRRRHHNNGDCRQKESSSLDLAMMMTHRLCTPLIRRPASRVASAVRVVRSSERCLISAKRSAIFVHRMCTRYTDKREDVFRDARHTQKESPTSTRQISSTCRVCRTSTTRIVIF